MGKMKRKIILLVAIVSILTLSGIFIFGSIRNYKNKSDEVIDNISEIYLAELSQKMIDHLSNNLASQFAQIKTITYSMTNSNFSTLDDLIIFLDGSIENNDFSHIAVVDSDGRAYSPDGEFSGISTISIIDQLFSNQGEILSFNETLWEEDMFLLGFSIEKTKIVDKDIIALIVGIDTNIIKQKILSSSSEMNSYVNMITTQGNFVIRSDSESNEKYGYNLFTTLERKAIFDKNYSVANFESNVNNGEKGMISFILNEDHEYLYYAPISGTNWVMCVNMRYDAIDNQIGSLTSFMLTVALTIIGIILISFCCILYLHISNEKRKHKLLVIEKEYAYKVSKTKSDFLSQITHEIRTPLNAVIGMTRLCYNHIEDSRKVENYLNKIEVSSTLLLSLVNDILDMSKIESGKVILHKEQFNIIELLRSLISIFYLQAKNKEITFNLGIHGELDEELIGDSLRISQVITNLLSNAFKFTNQHGKINVKIIAHDYQDNSLNLGIEVSDTGIGISKENLDKVFEAFVQEDTRITKRNEGTGLGLSITKGFVELMEGNISVESEVGKGSTFKITIPIERVSPPVNEYKPLTDRVLIISPEINADFNFCHRVKKEGFYVDLINNGNNILFELNEKIKNTYKYVFLKWNIKDIKDVVEAIKKNPTNAKSKIIIMGYDKTEVEEVKYFVSADQTLIIPVLQKEIEQVLSDKDVTVTSESNLYFDKKRILVVEDNELNKEITVELMKNAGALVDVASNGQEAIDIFSDSSLNYYDLILMDVRMPVLDGYNATKVIRNLNRADAKEVLIFAMTANVFQEDINKCKESGMNTHIGKPFQLSKIYNEYLKYKNNK